MNPQKIFNGNDSIIPLLLEFKNFSQNKIEEISSKFREISNLPADVKSKLLILDTGEFWFEIFKLKNTVGDKCYKNVCEFVFNILSLPHSSACAERIFSDLNNVKTKNRNRLLASTSNSLLPGKEVLNKKPCYEWVPSSSLINKNVEYRK